MEIIRNSEKYHFSDFTFEAYESLLLKEKENYAFCTYADFKQHPNLYY
jgi:hypothetical protein